MSTSRLVTWITFLAVFAMAARISVDTDTWWHLRAGEWILENRAVPQTDPFSYTRLGETWQYPGWLVEIPMALAYRLGGAGLLNLWTALMVTGAFIFIWFSLSGGVFLRAFTLVLAAAASAVYWAARPYLATFFLAAAFIWILEGYRWRGKDRLWWLPLLILVWVNCHGGFIVGFLLWGVYLFNACLSWAWVRWGSKENDAESRKRMLHLLLIGALMWAAVLVNPSGAAMYAYAFKTVGIGALQDYIQEWQSPDFHLLHVQPFAWLLLLTFAAVGASRRRLALTDFLLVAGFAYMGLMAGRNVALFALVAPLTFTRHAAPLLAVVGRRLGYQGLDRSPTKLGWLNWVIFSLILLATVLKAFSVYPASVNQEAFQRSLPLGAVEYLQNHRPPGRLFNSYNWGGYLLWALPEYPVFIDGRTDLYSDEVISEWLQVMRAEPGWQAVLENYAVNLILVENDVLLDRLLENDRAWKLLYEDGLAVIYQRQ
jgi:hypothetical protein